MKVRDLIYMLQTYGRPNDELFMMAHRHTKNGCEEVIEPFDGDFDSVFRRDDQEGMEHDVENEVTYLRCPISFLEEVTQAILRSEEEASYDERPAAVTELFPPSTDKIE